MFSFDPLGVPYSLSYGPEFATATAVRLDDFTPPPTLETVPRTTGKTQRNESLIAQAHYGSPLTHHAQQATALHYLRQHSGFDPVVGATIHYPGHDADLFLQVPTGYWVEKTIAPTALSD